MIFFSELGSLAAS